MAKPDPLVIAKTAAGQSIGLLPEMANRHGLITGATGTGKTVTLQVLAEFGSTGPRGGRREGMVEAAAKSAARTVGSTIGREIMRGMFGSLLSRGR